MKNLKNLFGTDGIRGVMEAKTCLASEMSFIPSLAHVLTILSWSQEYGRSILPFAWGESA